MLKKETLTKPAWVASITAFLFGIFVHLFGLVNCLHNYDDIAVQPKGFGTGLESGRWFLENLGYVMEKCLGGHNVPLFNGVVFFLLLAVSVGLLVAAFKIKSRWLAVFLGAMFVVFPTATSTMFFTYTAVHYGIAILLAAAAVWVLPKFKYAGFFLSAVCTAFALGIYQAYLPLTLAFFVLLVLRKALSDDAKPGETIGYGAYACGSLILGLILYFVILKVTLKNHNMELSTYQGVDSMGKLSISRLPELLGRMIKSFCKLPLEDYCNLAQTKLLKGGYVLLALISGAELVYCLVKKKKKVSMILLCLLLCAVFPIAVNSIILMCPDSWIYTLMVYSFVSVFWLPVILWEMLPADTGWKKHLKPVSFKAIGAVMGIMIISYSYLANVNYVSIHFANRQTENYVSSMVAQVRMTEGFDTNKKWALVGNINDPLLRGIWSDVPKYGGNQSPGGLLNAYSRNKWFATYVGYSLPYATDSEIAQIKQTEEYQSMPCWPAEGSIRVIDEFVVIKCQ